MPTWILVADTSRARLFSAAQGDGQLKELQDFIDVDARRHTHELTSDLPGRAFDHLGDARHAMEQDVDPKQAQAMQFADELIEQLEHGRTHHRFDRLYIVAPPAMLGLLRQRYGPLASMVAGEIDKHLSQCTPEDLRAYLPPRL